MTGILHDPAIATGSKVVFWSKMGNFERCIFQKFVRHIFCFSHFILSAFGGLAVVAVVAVVAGIDVAAAIVVVVAIAVVNAIVVESVDVVIHNTADFVTLLLSVDTCVNLKKVRLHLWFCVVALGSI